jgi:hypothetical protein
VAFVAAVGEEFPEHPEGVAFTLGQELLEALGDVTVPRGFGRAARRGDQLGVSRHELFKLEMQQHVDIDAVDTLAVVVLLRRWVVARRGRQKRTEIFGETSRANLIDIHHGVPLQA